MNERIKNVRKELNLTQQQFADRLGIARNNIAGYETSKRCPSDAVISLICRVFGVNELWLRNGDGEMFEHIPEEDLYATAAAEIMKGSSPEDKKVQQLLINYFQMSPESKKLLFDLVEKLFNGLDDSKESEQ